MSVSPVSGRIGRFRISGELYREWSPNVDRLFSELELIESSQLRSETGEFIDVRELVASHPEFDEIPEGAEIPEYEVLFRRYDDGTVVRQFRRIMSHSIMQETDEGLFVRGANHSAPCMTESCPRPVFYTERGLRALGISRIYYCPECLDLRRQLIAELVRLSAALIRTDEDLTERIHIMGRSPDQLLHSPEISIVELEAHIFQLYSRQTEVQALESVIDEHTAQTVTAMSQAQRQMLEQLEAQRQAAMRPPPPVERFLSDDRLFSRFDSDLHVLGEAERVNSYNQPPRGGQLTNITFDTFDDIDDSPPVLMSPAQVQAYQSLFNNISVDENVPQGLAYFVRSGNSDPAVLRNILSGVKEKEKPKPKEKLRKPKRGYSYSYGADRLYWQLYHTLQNPCEYDNSCDGEPLEGIIYHHSGLPIKVKVDRTGDVYIKDKYYFVVSGSFSGRQVDFYRELNTMLEITFLCEKNDTENCTWSRFVDEIHCRLIGLTVKKALKITAFAEHSDGFSVSASFEVPEGTYLFTDERIYWHFKRQKAFPEAKKSVRKLDLSIYLGKNG